MSVGSRADPGLGSQPTDDIVMNLAVGCNLSARPAVIIINNNNNLICIAPVCAKKTSVTFPVRDHHRP